jgi:uncharacterized membrane protein YkoI
MFLAVKSGLAIALLLAVPMVSMTQADGQRKHDQCFADWSAAAAIVTREELVSVEALGRQFRRQKLGDIVKTELCQRNGEFIYRLVVRDPNGRFRSAIYDARRGIEVGIAGFK